MLEAVFVKKSSGINNSKLSKTRWTQKVLDGEVSSLYPRPCMVRNSYICLDGLWDYAITDDDAFPSTFEGKIRVPFSPESFLSGVLRQLQPNETLWYTRNFLLPELECGFHYRLNFGAVDQQCKVYINKEEIASHIGGYLPFSIDLKNDWTKEEFELTVEVKDESDESYHARGKQRLKRGGMFYTAQSGIWQTVWIEKVPNSYIESVNIRPDLDSSSVYVDITLNETFKISNEPTPEVFSYVREDTEDDQISRDSGIVPLEKESVSVLSKASGTSCRLKIDDPRLWTPDDSYLYHLVVSTDLDCVHCYFAMRSISIKEGENGYVCFYLNNEPMVQTGLLDQGYWPDGLYTAPCDDALIYDIKTAKSLGFNMLRKHIKIEPQRWYYHCDRLGMLVWQDMVCGGAKIKQWFVTYLATVLNIYHIPMSDRKISRFFLSRISKAGRDEFEKEVKLTIETLYNHPSIVMWVPFNEGWGQFDSVRITKDIKSYDSTRLVDHASGWFDQGAGDVVSLHYYFFRLHFRPEKERALALTEYGGYTLKVSGHTYSDNLYGYGGYNNKEELTKGFKKLMDTVIIPARKKGIFGFVYTQLSDIEDEVNGIMTYDREVIKIDEDVLRLVNKELKDNYNKVDKS